MPVSIQQFSKYKKKGYILSELIFRKPQVVIEIIVKNGRALVKRRSSDRNAFTDIFFSLKNVLSELVDLTKELNKKMKLHFRHYQASNHKSDHEMQENSLGSIDSFI